MKTQRVDLRQYPKLMNELAPLIFRKEFTVSSKDATWILKTQFDIDMKVVEGDRILYGSVSEKTLTWLNLKWR